MVQMTNRHPYLAARSQTSAAFRCLHSLAEKPAVFRKCDRIRINQSASTRTRRQRRVQISPIVDDSPDPGADS
jgi:hypothetical protein